MKMRIIIGSAKGSFLLRINIKYHIGGFNLNRSLWKAFILQNAKVIYKIADAPHSWLVNFLSIIQWMFRIQTHCNLELELFSAAAPDFAFSYAKVMVYVLGEKNWASIYFRSLFSDPHTILSISKALSTKSMRRNFFHQFSRHSHR